MRWHPRNASAAVPLCARIRQDLQRSLAEYLDADLVEHVERRQMHLLDVVLIDDLERFDSHLATIHRTVAQSNTFRSRSLQELNHSYSSGCVPRVNYYPPFA